MKRRVLTILPFLLLGAIVNVAVAWGLAQSDSPERRQGLWRSTGYAQWHDWQWVTFTMQEDRGRARARCVWQNKESRLLINFIATDSPPLESVVPAWARWVLPRTDQSGAIRHSRTVDLRGWPCLSLRSKCEAREDTMEFRNCIHLQDRLGRTGWDNASPRMLPFEPLWPGFAINTLFYAAILGAFFAVPAALRRKRRIKRGVCPKCAYPIGDSPVCTECGNALPPSLALMVSAPSPLPSPSSTRCDS